MDLRKKVDLALAKVEKIKQEKMVLYKKQVAKVLDIVQPLTKYQLVCDLDRYTNNNHISLYFYSSDYVIEFATDIDIHLNSDSQIEISHSVGFSGSTSERVKTRPYLIERDMLVAKLWNKQDKLLKLIKSWKSNKIHDKLQKAITEKDYANQELNEAIEQANKNKYLEKAKSSKYFYECYGGCNYYYYGIVKITEKMVYYNKVQKSYGGDYYVSSITKKQMKLGEFLSNVKCGNYKLVNEIDSDKWDWRHQTNY